MKEENSSGEKRRYTRVSVDAYVAATLISEDVFREKVFIGKEMSPEGIFLVSREAFALGSIMRLEVHTPTTAEPIKIEARVVRVAKDEKSQAPVGVGLVFTKINEADRKELFKHLYLAYHYVKPENTES